MEKQNLRKYVSEAYPEVNRLLRNNEDASEYIFDSLFERSIIPQPLYRFVNNEHIQISDGIFTDKGYLSCTSDFDAFIGRVDGIDIACLQIEIQDSSPRIDVYALLPSYNNESEFILPRGLEFEVTHMQVFSTYSEIQNFLDSIESTSSAIEICDILKIETIHYYKISLVSH